MKFGRFRGIERALAEDFNLEVKGSPKEHGHLSGKLRRGSDERITLCGKYHHLQFALQELSEAAVHYLNRELTERIKKELAKKFGKEDQQFAYSYPLDHLDGVVLHGGTLEASSSPEHIDTSVIPKHNRVEVEIRRTTFAEGYNFLRYADFNGLAYTPRIIRPIVVMSNTTQMY